MLEFKEMEYLAEDDEIGWFRSRKFYKRDLLGTGEHKGYKFYMLNLGTHPTAYVEIPEGHSLYNKHYYYIDCDDYDDIDVHGGITYTADHLRLPNEELKGWFVGWDYNHYYDYNSRYNISGKKWTTSEIYEDVKKVIEQLKLMEVSDNNG